MKQSSSEKKRTSNEQASWGYYGVLFSGVLLWGLLAWITLLSPAFRYEVPNARCPIVLVTVLYIVASLVSLVSLYIAIQTRSVKRELLFVIVILSLAFRLVQLFAPPFQEVDLYRYMWDGMVTGQGHSPYRYSPEKVLNGRPSNDPDLEDLRQLRDRSESSFQILNRVHFKEYTSIYPPVSQIVFRAAMSLVPGNASVDTHLFLMKFVLTLFDAGTLLLLIVLLRTMKLHPGWLIAYGWNPLVIKEVSNSGHLDSIAVFFTTAALVCFVRYLRSWNAGSSEKGKPFPVWLLLSAGGLGLGIGAKIYPVVLFPLLIGVLYFRKGIVPALLFAIAFLTTTGICLLPMVLEIQRAKRIAQDQAEEQRQNSLAAPDQKEGLTSFLSQWEINEFVFMLIQENLREIDDNEYANRPWFRVSSSGFRERVNRIGNWGKNRANAAKNTTRVLTLGLFGILYTWMLVHCVRSTRSDWDILFGCFWILAVFFYLQPTQNPWYWTWSLPLIPFARNIGCLAYSPLLFIYYLLFAFRTLSGKITFLGYSYTPEYYFHYVMVFVEHLPVLILVLIFIWVQPRTTRAHTDESN